LKTVRKPIPFRQYTQNMEKQFMKYYDTHSDAIFRHCLYRLHDRDLALEFTQETFLRLWKEITQHKKIRYIKTFLYRIATNLIIDYSRKKKENSLDALREKGFDIQNGIVQHMIADIDFSFLKTILADMDDDDRLLLFLRYVDKCKTAEIAEILGENTNVISVRLHRAKKKCNILLKQKNFHL